MSLREALVRLMNVKSIVTIVLTLVFAALTLRGMVDAGLACLPLLQGFFFRPPARAPPGGGGGGLPHPAPLGVFPTGPRCAIVWF